ncbi:MAG: hypothetical protein AVDCRST_MAG93-2429 [uncultured Chloroflexia bacterium]|uniref:Uncharacterized protein n=1 Tax=uncultured Chloroflexia bacterium TaxID=1672391 RepID=A0A6J4IZF8_9CHLR|nr:MAG: hypothetical protein AVDCRST_MAG93-2429 [uncultured Chloroflexia bacterium]
MDAYEGETVRLQQPCPLCQGTMEEGFLLDQGRAAGTQPSGSRGYLSGHGGQWASSTPGTRDGTPYPRFGVKSVAFWPRLPRHP